MIFSPRIGIADAADYQAYRLQSCFGGKAPDYRQVREIAPQILAIVGLRNGSMRNAGMKINRHIEGLCAFKNAPEALFIEKGTRGQAVNQSSFEAMPDYRAFKLVCSCLRVDGGEFGETGEPRGMKDGYVGDGSVRAYASARYVLLSVSPRSVLAAELVSTELARPEMAGTGLPAWAAKLSIGCCSVVRWAS